ncbi:MAG: hypothetical protein WDO19_23300 [Bacteroidota bacterium]
MDFKISLVSAFILLTGASSGNGQPSFVPQVIDTSIKIGYGLALADVDGDGQDRYTAGRQ